MRDNTPFLRKIMDYPHEVGPRLVFADWLEERGDPWGELIRLQCELATTYQEQKLDEYLRWFAEPPIGFPVIGMIERCGRLLDTLTPTIIKRMLDVYYGNGLAMVNQWRAVEGDLIWWRESAWDGADKVRLFFWRGMPERAALTCSNQWCDWHVECMGAFPISMLQIRGWALEEDVLNLVAQYAGRLMTLDVATWTPTNAFTAWTANLLDDIGEKCHAATGQPFTLKIGQAVMGGPPHSAANRWQAYCDRWLKDSNVRIVSRLGARPIGQAMPSGVTLTTPPRGR